MVIKALVAARSGSVRVQNKNIRHFAGSSLLELKLKQLKRIKGLNGIIINSSCKKQSKRFYYLSHATAAESAMSVASTASVASAFSCCSCCEKRRLVA